MNDQTKRLRGGAVEVCPECDIAGCRHIRARAALAAQPAASAEPSDEEIMDVWMVSPQGPHMRDQLLGFARALLSRYGRPAGDAQPVAWVAADTLNSPHPKCVSSLAYVSQIDQDRGREYVPLYAAPVAAQKAGEVERIRSAGEMLDCLTSKLADDHPLRLEAAEGAKRAVADLYRIADRLDAAIAQQRKGEGEGDEHGNG